MFLMVRCSMMAACACLCVPSPVDPVPQPAVQVAGEDVELEFDAEGEPLPEYLALFQRLLGVPVDSLPEQTQSIRVHSEGPQRIARARLRDHFESVLLRYGFWAWDDVSGGEAQVVVRRMSPAGSRGASPPPSFTPRFVSLEELQSGPAPRLPLYSVAFELKHIQPRDTLVLLSMSLDAAFESVRIVEGNQVMLVTASREHLLYVRDLLAKADVLPPDGGPPADRLAVLEQRLESIEARLEALEAQPAR
jgi:hypothetical protein